MMSLSSLSLTTISEMVLFVAAVKEIEIVILVVISEVLMILAEVEIVIVIVVVISE